MTAYRTLFLCLVVAAFCPTTWANGEQRHQIEYDNSDLHPDSCYRVEHVALSVLRNVRDVQLVSGSISCVAETAYPPSGLSFNMAVEKKASAQSRGARISISLGGYNRDNYGHPNEDPPEISDLTSFANSILATLEVAGSCSSRSELQSDPYQIQYYLECM